MNRYKESFIQRRSKAGRLLRLYASEHHANRMASIRGCFGWRKFKWQTRP